MQTKVKPLLDLLDRFSGRIEKRRIFSDFLWFAACLISNDFDPVHCEQRGKETKRIETQYTHEELALFGEMLTSLGDSIKRCTLNGHYEDILGRVFEETNCKNKNLGQDLTPSGIASLMAMILVKEATGEIRTVNEPTCGGGMLILSYAEEMTRAGRNYPTEMVVLAQDIDMRCVLMSYIQLSLYGIPAVVLRADTLLAKEYDRWYTPMYILGDWVWRQPFSIEGGRVWEDELLKIAQQPMYGFIRYPDLMWGKRKDSEKEGGVQYA